MAGIEGPRLSTLIPCVGWGPWGSRCLLTCFCRNIPCVLFHGHGLGLWCWAGSSLTCSYLAGLQGDVLPRTICPVRPLARDGVTREPASGWLRGTNVGFGSRPGTGQERLRSQGRIPPSARSQRVRGHQLCRFPPSRGRPAKGLSVCLLRGGEGREEREGPVVAQEKSARVMGQGSQIWKDWEIQHHGF